MKKPKLKICIFSDHYLPGYKSGGPLRTLSSMVKRLGKEFQFKIVTRDRDSKDIVAYSDIKVDNWNNIKKVQVLYLSPKNCGFKNFKKILCSTEYDLLYLNSFFSFHFTIKPLLLRLLNLIPNVPVIIAPRGEFSIGAIKLKKIKKQIFIFFAKIIKLYKKIIWQASSQYEKDDIQRIFGNNIPVIIASNLADINQEIDFKKSYKNLRSLKIIYLSRISRMKNLDVALNILKTMKEEIYFNIYGPVDDQIYWGQCQRIIDSLPENIKVKYHGSVAHNQVSSIMNKHDLFFLPTKGENFGHVILEAMLAGCPVLISDQTPWRGLEVKHVGWDIPLNEPQQFHKALITCFNMNKDQHKKWCESAREYGLNFVYDEKIVEQNRELFYKAWDIGQYMEKEL
ncbi:Glycosyl transferases group 1 [Candidatus Magnetomoraceae bacterium gMMP-15]